MERDYEFSSKLFFADLRAPEEIGREAGERTVRRVNPRKAATGTVTCVFDPRVARGMLGHLGGAINGASVARKTSFLRDKMGQPVANPAITVIDEPMRRRGQGVIVNLGSISWHLGQPGMVLYETAKAGIEGLTRALASELGSDGIRVNCIAPVALTPAMERAYGENPVLHERLLERTPLGRIGDPLDDVGPVAVFLASEMARFITGQTLCVDGGGFLGL